MPFSAKLTISFEIPTASRCDQFFFSSRRRHTRLTCDWSSDVCSSDLVTHTTGVPLASAQTMSPIVDFGVSSRSEERRVGKECRSLSPLHHKRKNNQFCQNRVGRITDYQKRNSIDVSHLAATDDWVELI